MRCLIQAMAHTYRILMAQILNSHVRRGILESITSFSQWYDDKLKSNPAPAE